MNEKRYVLKKGDFYLSDVDVVLDDQAYLNHFEVDKDFRKLFNDFDIAEEIRKIIFIETGLAFEVKIFRKEEE